jgi:hypothetical protein
MAVRAEQLEVLEPVVVAIAVHVMQLERDRYSALEAEPRLTVSDGVPRAS